jgi:beta-lactamase class A
MGLLKNKFLYLIVLAFVGGIIGGILVDSNLLNASRADSQNPSLSSLLDSVREIHSGGYKLINPLYECNTGVPYGTIQLLDLNNNISNYINKITANNTVARVAVWFRDLNNGPWFGINEEDLFAPSSLLKVPVMMAYYKEAEVNPSILDQKITYSQNLQGAYKEFFPAKHPIVLGNTYTVEELIEHMIVESDNSALLLLQDKIGEQKINQVTTDLGITNYEDLSMSVKDYSTLFRILYYSTYLNRTYSEKALELLTKVEFKEGLVAPIPKDLTVAHKFGERLTEDGTHQLHDCGIIYYAKRPYLLCIMTKGPDFNDLLSTIQQISQKVYTEISSQK